MTMSPQPYQITTLTPTPSRKPLHDLYQSTLSNLVPAYSLPAEKFDSLLTAPLAKVFVATPVSLPSACPTSNITASHHSIPSSSAPARSPGRDDDPEILGFAITYLIRSGSFTSPSLQHFKGSVALLVVAPGHWNRGIGTALHAAALGHLTESVKASFGLSSPPATSSQVQLGSIFPRIFPGLPTGPEFTEAKRWFEGRGWGFQKDDEGSIDLHRRLTPGDPPGLGDLMRQAEENGFTFRPPRAEEDEELCSMERADFDTYTGWPDMFPALISIGSRDDIQCAFDSTGKLVGATVAALGPLSGELKDEGTMHRSLAWPCTLGTRCAIVACVGIASSARGSGAGIALVVSSVIRLASRGADGCFVDWVNLKGFYEKAGFEKWERGYLDSWRTVTAWIPFLHEEYWR